MKTAAICKKAKAPKVLHGIKGQPVNFEKPVSRARAMRFAGHVTFKKPKVKKLYSVNFFNKEQPVPKPLTAKLLDAVPENVAYILAVRARHPKV